MEGGLGGAAERSSGIWSARACKCQKEGKGMSVLSLTRTRIKKQETRSIY